MVGYLCLFSSRNPGMDRRGREAERGGGFTDTFMPDLLSGLGELGVASCRARLQQVLIQEYNAGGGFLLC